MRVKRSVFLVSCLLLLIILAGVFMYYKPHRSVGESDVAFKISAIDLFNDFKEDEAKANTAYLDKVLEVHGILMQITFDDSGVALMLGDRQLDAGISCHMTDDDKGQFRKIKEGDIVTVKGICNGMLFDVVLDKCVLVQKK